MTRREQDASTPASAVRAGVAVAIAVVSVSAAAAVLVTHENRTAASPDGGSEVTTSPDPLISDPSVPAHNARWQLDAADVFGRTFTAFVSPTESLQFDSGVSEVIDAGGTVVAAVGLPNPRTYMLDQARLVGIDASDGTVRWSVAPEGGLDSCADKPIRGEIICFDPYSDDPGFVAIDVRDGAIRRVPIPTGWFPYAIAADDDRLFVLEGNPEDSESVLHGGDLDALDRAWSFPVDAFAPWEGVEGTLIHVADGRGVVTLGGEARFFDPLTGEPVDGLELQASGTVVDTAAGNEVWQLDEPGDTEMNVDGTVYTVTGPSVLASKAGTGEKLWAWNVPTGSDGFPVSGSIQAVGAAMYFVSSSALIQLVAP